MAMLHDVLTAAGKFSRGYSQMLLRGITPEIFARKPRFETTAGTKVIDTNHPAFVFGHLSLYPARMLAMLGADAAPAQPPAGWTELFTAGAECRDDPAGTIYPAMETVTGHFLRTHDLAVEHIRSIPEEMLSRENPNERSRDRFPTIGAAVNFYVGGHVMVHLGQISAWRRCFGLPSAL